MKRIPIPIRKQPQMSRSSSNSAESIIAEARQLALDLNTAVMSNRQYAALRVFTDIPGTVISPEEALKIDQRPFGSIFHRMYIVYNRSIGGFVATELGHKARRVYDATDVYKKTVGTEFSHYIRITKALGQYGRTA